MLVVIRYLLVGAPKRLHRPVQACVMAFVQRFDSTLALLEWLVKEGGQTSRVEARVRLGRMNI